MEGGSRRSCEERHEPVDDCHQDGGNRPEREPDQVRQREEQPEEDRYAGAAQIVRIPDEVHRMLWRPLDADEHRRRVGVRIAVGHQQYVGEHLRAIADAVRARVAQALRHLAAHDTREPAEDGGSEGERAPAARAIGSVAATAARELEAPGAAAAQSRGEHDGRKCEENPQ